MRGPYLGQKAPGAAPAVFADGIMAMAPVFTPDGREAYWTQAEGNFRSVLMISRCREGEWTAPVPVPFSKPEFMDHNAAFSRDGWTMVFAASRTAAGRPRTFIQGTPMPASDIWIVRRDGAGSWGEPEILDAPINTEFDEDSPRMAADGTIYYSSERPWGNGYAGLCRTRSVGGRYLDMEVLPMPPHSKFGEIAEAVAPDQSYLLFRSMRPGGFGRADVYISFAGRDGAWSMPLNLGEDFNRTPRWALSFSPDRRFLFFTSRAGGKPQAYWVEAPRIDELRRKAAFNE